MLYTFSDVPEITKYPEDITADEGATVEFHCAVDEDDPHIRLGWKKQDGAVDKQRYVAHFIICAPCRENLL